MTADPDASGAPGAELVLEGLRALREGRFDTVEGLLVAIGAPRLRAVGFRLPAPLPSNPEALLYALLSSANPLGAHAAYNALVRRLVSFEQTMEHRERDRFGKAT